jgi:hypothetical protein
MCDAVAEPADASRLPAKAKANGTGYADLTARNAALAVERRRRKPARLADGGTQARLNCIASNRQIWLGN